MKNLEDRDPIDDAIDEGLRRRFGAPSPAELKAWSAVDSPSRKRRAWRPRWVAVVAAAAMLLLLLRFVGEGQEKGDAQLSKAWLQRWEEMATTPSEFRICTLTDSPTGLLSAARSQLGLHLESEALLTAHAPEEREQRLDDTQGVQIVLGDFAYLFFAQRAGTPPRFKEFEEKGLRVTAREFGEIRLYEVAGRKAPGVIGELRLVGGDPR